MDSQTKELFDFIKACPTGYHAVLQMQDMLEKNGYACLDEKDAWEITPGRRYYTVRGGSSLIAFCIPETEAKSFRIMGAFTIPRTS